MCRKRHTATLSSLKLASSVLHALSKQTLALCTPHINLPSKFVSPPQVSSTAQQQIKTFNVPKRKTRPKSERLEAWPPTQGEAEREEPEAPYRDYFHCSRERARPTVGPTPCPAPQAWRRRTHPPEAAAWRQVRPRLSGVLMSNPAESTCSLLSEDTMLYSWPAGAHQPEITPRSPEHLPAHHPASQRHIPEESSFRQQSENPKRTAKCRGNMSWIPRLGRGGGTQPRSQARTSYRVPFCGPPLPPP